MACSRGGDAMKKFIYWGNPKSNSKNICKKIDLKQLNAFQEKGKQKNSNTQKWLKNPQNSSPEKNDSYENNFMQSFQTR